MQNCPYPGLRPFTSNEADVFFGRDEQTYQLLKKLADTRFIGVVGLSGCGKSSLVRAGLIPALETGLLRNASGRWQVAMMSPGNNPLSRLAEAVRPFLKIAPPDRVLLPFLQASLRRGPFSCVEFFRQNPLPDDTNLLLLVDQFEELFRYHRDGSREESAAFVKLLLASVQQDEIPIYVVTTMRSDFIGECARFYDLPEMMNQGQFLVPRLTRDQQWAAIAEPAKVAGGVVEPRLVNQLLNAMGTDPDQLPILQHCLMRMWLLAQKHATTDVITLTIQAYEESGGLQAAPRHANEAEEAPTDLQGALSRHANEAYKELDQTRQKIAEKMFRGLTEGDLRRPAQIKELAELANASVAEIISVANVFRQADRCFLTPSGDAPLAPETVLDISHESLIRQWPRLREWTREEAEAAGIYRRLEQTANLWEQRKAELWGRLDVETAREWRERERPTSAWAARYGHKFDLSIEFLEASRRAEVEKSERAEQERQKKLEFERERQLHQERQRILKIVFVSLIITIMLAAGVVIAWIKAKKAQELAEQQMVIAKQQTVIARQQRQKAEKQTQLAQVEKTRADYASASFQEMVTATFGFLTERDLIKVFAEWTRSSSITERLTPALALLIEQSESMDDETKKFYVDNLRTMNEENRTFLLLILGAEAAKKTKNQ